MDAIALEPSERLHAAPPAARFLFSSVLSDPESLFHGLGCFGMAASVAVEGAAVEVVVVVVMEREQLRRWLETVRA